MNTEVSVAVLRLQARLMSGRLPHWRAEQTEEALNNLLSRPDRMGDPFHLERNAMSDARKKLQRRAALFAEHVAEIEVMGEPGAGGGRIAETLPILQVDVLDTIERVSGDTDREILTVAMGGGGAAEVAEMLGITYEVAKVRLSRARQRASVSWGRA